MARVLKLVKGATTLNLLNNTDGISLRSGGDNWQPVYPIVSGYGEPEPVVETMRLQCRGTSQNAIAGTMQIWADMMRGASIYRTDANGTAPVWLHAKLDDETNERRSIVHRIDAAWVDSGMTETIDQDVLLFDAAIERGPYWEATSPTAFGTMSYANLIQNGSFEVGGAGSWDPWTQSFPGGDFSDGGTLSIYGSHSAYVAANNAGTAYLSQTFSVAPSTRYTLSFWAYGDADYAALAWLYDQPAGTAFYTGNINIGDAAWTAIVTPFVTPAGCGTAELRLGFLPGLGPYMCFDEVVVSQTPMGMSAMIPYTGVPGDVPARLAPFTLYQPTSGTAYWGRDIDHVWIGVRSQGQFNFATYPWYEWEAETVNATLGTNAARVLDATASGMKAKPGGYVDTSKVTVTPGTATWARRLIFTRAALDALTQNGTGRFLWLLRTKVSAGTWNVGLKWCYGDSTTSSASESGPKVEVTETQWTVKEMGMAGIPLYDQQAFPPEMLNTSANLAWRVEVWAERTAGVGTLDLDCMIPVPVDEGYLVVKDANMTAGTATYNALAISTSPFGTCGAAVVDNSGYVQNAPAVQQWGWGLPPGDGALVMVASAGTAEDRLIRYIINTPGTALLDAPAYYPRWLSLRGAE